MLPPFIIEQIRKREEEMRRRDERPVLELPLEEPVRPARPADPSPDDKRDDEPRGVVIIDFGRGSK